MRLSKRIQEKVEKGIQSVVMQLAKEAADDISDMLPKVPLSNAYQVTLETRKKLVQQIRDRLANIEEAVNLLEERIDKEIAKKKKES